MPAGNPAFIDLAVHDQIRERYARGEALVLLTPALDAVLWANGAGAALFGFGDVYEFMDEWADRATPAQRQLHAAAARHRSSGSSVEVMLRISAGLKSRLQPTRLVAIALGEGSDAILLSAGDGGAAPSEDVRADRIVSGLGADGTHVAALDAAGTVLAASPGFGEISIDAGALATLVADVAAADGRLVKRRVSTAAGSIPAAIARLSDQPALHLLFAVEAENSDHTVSMRTIADNVPVADEAADDAPPAPGAPPAQDVPDERSAQNETRSPPARLPDLQEGFVFKAGGRPVRFVWKIDSEGRFSEISPDFGTAVGPNAADVVGRRFSDVAQVFGIDRDGAIGDLLGRRDTWSGRSVMWPVEGTALVVPVDLAALPTYTRDRAFDGFRGFGIVRVAEAVEDPEALGLTLASRTAPPEPGGDTRPPGGTVGASEPLPDESTPVAADTREPPEREDAVPPPAAADDDPFKGEVPALKFEDEPVAPPADKVIDLEQRRDRRRDPLSSGERAAFREIGRRLAETFGRRSRNSDGADANNETARPSDRPATGTPASGGTPERDGEPGKAAEANDNGRPEETGPDRSGETAAASGPAREPAAGGTDPADATGPDVNDAPAQAGSDTGDPAPPAADGAPQRPSYDESLIDDLPIALIIHQGDMVHHANAEFFALTGYADLDALRAAGGIGSLFSDGDGADEGDTGPPGALSLVEATGRERPVNARLQSILWRNRHALMTSLVPTALPLPAEAAQAGVAGDAAQTEALKVEVEELRSILETATDGVIILGEHGDIRSMNRSASALFDYEEAETRGAPFAKLFAHESQRAVMDYLNGLSEHGVASVLNDGREVIGREASGGFIPLFMTIGRLSGSKGFCAVMRDITQWKRTEEDLRAAKYAAEQASSHKSAFLARVSHEIRTPLNAIIGFSDMMAEERFGPIGNPRYLEYARDIGRSGKHVLDIVNDLLDISKIEAGEMDIEFAAVALNETIAETVSLLQPQANSQRVIIRTSLSSAVPEVVADERSIKQVAINLLSNAIRFTPAGGQIVVSTAYEATGSVILRIRDTGIGMSRDDLEQAMKPFRQVEGTSRPREGTGLGLPLTKAMVEANRAQFEIRSTPNEGTLVEISFPSQRVLAD